MYATVYPSRFFFVRMRKRINPTFSAFITLKPEQNKSVTLLLAQNNYNSGRKASERGVKWRYYVSDLPDPICLGASVTHAPTHFLGQAH